MSNSQPTDSTSVPALRLWPGVLLVLVQWILRYAIPPLVPGFTGIGMISAFLLTLLIFGWWLSFSRAPKRVRWSAMLIVALSIVATYPLAHPSLASGMMGLAIVLYSTPLLCLVLVAWAAVGRGASSGKSYASLIVGCLIACGALSLLRSDGVRGEDGSDFAWRWAQTPEELLLAQGEEQTVEVPEAFSMDSDANEWPGFRGPQRDSVMRGTRIETDWSSSPPVKLWSRAIGPAWSSFAVRGDLFFTQEQRGEEEIVGCYRVSTGEPVWRHRDPIRFWESNAGAGPRATPTLHGERLFTLGATGTLNALSVVDGQTIWTRDAAQEANAETPTWGFSSSPLVVDDLVIVALPSTLLAYGVQDGKLHWTGPAGDQSYSSPQLLTLGGVSQIVMLREHSAIGVSPTSGALLWEHSIDGVPCVQPVLCPNGDVLLGGGQGVGVSRVSVQSGSSGWTTEERWHSRRMKPYFNDYAVHKEQVYGFDGSLLACIDLESGERLWKGGRYGYGQFLLLADQDLILLLTEQGEIALVEAKPQAFTELGRVPAIEGKTWNLPVLAEDVLLVRNDQEMAAFRLATIGE